MKGCQVFPKGISPYFLNTGGPLRLARLPCPRWDSHGRRREPRSARPVPVKTWRTKVHRHFACRDGEIDERSPSGSPGGGAIRSFICCLGAGVERTGSRVLRANIANAFRAKNPSLSDERATASLGLKPAYRPNFPKPRCGLPTQTANDKGYHSCIQVHEPTGPSKQSAQFVTAVSVQWRAVSHRTDH
jgi:hypothetical protein